MHFFLLAFLLILSSCKGEWFSTTELPVSYKIKNAFYKQLGTGHTGTSGAESAYGIISDDFGNNYIIGSTTGDLAEANGGGANRDIYVTKTNISGSIEWTRQLGGPSMVAYNIANATAWNSSGSDYPSEIKFDSAGNLIIAACTTGSLGGTNPVPGLRDLVVLKMTTSGSLVWIKQLGTEMAIAEGIGAPVGDDCGLEFDIYDYASMVIDSSDNLFIASYTDSDLGELHGGADAYVVKFNSNMSIDWLTHYGSVSVPAVNAAYSAAGCEWPTDIVLDNGGHPHIIGYSWCNATTIGGPSQGLGDVFWSKLDKASGLIQWIGQHGGNAWDTLQAVTLGPDGNLIAVGATSSIALFGDTNAGAWWDLIIMNINSSNGSLIWGKAFGTTAQTAYSKDFSGQEMANDVILHTNGFLYITGWTTGNLAETVSGTSNTWIGKFNPSTGAPVSITQFGAVTYPGPLAPTGDTQPLTMVEGPAGNILISGFTSGNFVEASGGGNDLWYLGYNPLYGL